MLVVSSCCRNDVKAPTRMSFVVSVSHKGFLADFEQIWTKEDGYQIE